MFQNTLNEQQNVVVQNMCQLYIDTKKLMLYAEELDPNFNSNIQILKELRDGLDHIFRVLVDIRINEGKEYSELNNSGNGDYYYINLDKAYGHIYRATFDCLDGMCLSIRQEISNLTSGLTYEDILFVWNDYSIVKTKLYEMEENFARFRENKDVGKDFKEIVNQYLNEIDKLVGIYKEVPHYVAQAIQAKKERNKKEKRGKIRGYMEKIAFIIIGIIITAILGNIIKDNKTKQPNNIQNNKSITNQK